MIKTHRPRGHFWTCPSLFQESKQFGEVEYEDYAAPGCVIVGVDSEEQFSASQRAAKRQRIENIALDFLVGQPIRLASTAFRPHTIKTAIEWNQRSLTEQSFAFAESRENETTSSTWADVEIQAGVTGDEQASGKVKDAMPRCGGSESLSRCSTTSMGSAKGLRCIPVLRRRSAAFPTGPSTDALEKAAALRKSRLLKANREAQTLRIQSNVSEPEIFSASTCTVGRPMPDTKHSKSHHAGARRDKVQYLQEEDDSRDGLRLSRCGEQSRSQDTASSLDGPNLSDSLLHTAHCTEEPLSSSMIGSTRHIAGFSKVCGRSHSNDSASFMVTEEVERTREDILPHEEAPRLKDALTRREQSGRDRGVIVPVCVEKQTQGISHDGGYDQRRHSAPCSFLKSVEQMAGGLNVSPDQRSALESGMHAKGYIVAPAPSDGSTPFVYRKRGKKPKKNSKKITDSETTSIAHAIHQFTPYQIDANLSMQTAPADVDKLALNPDTPLVDAHLNTEFTSMAKTDDARLSLRKALRRELRNSGATIADAAGNVPRSSPDLVLVTQGQAYIDAQAENAIDVVPLTAWLGTQRLLQQAEKDLFGSQRDIHDDDGLDADLNDHKQAFDPRNEREPLRELSQASQEYIGTQTLVGTWSPWSTVKKPVNRNLAELSAASPWSGERHSAASQYKSTVAEESSAVDKSLARRSLRRSSRQQLAASNKKSSSAVTNLEFSVQKTQSSTESSGRKASITEVNAPGPVLQVLYKPPNGRAVSNSAALHKPGPNHQNADFEALESTMTTTITTGQPLPSYQGAQPPDDESQINGIINDLTTSVLRTDDMDGILSQV